MVNHPGVILADEPKGNLDSGSGARVMDSLRELHRGVGIPVVLVTYDEHLAGLADCSIHLADGKIVSLQ